MRVSVMRRVFNLRALVGGGLTGLLIFSCAPAPTGPEPVRLTAGMPVSRIIVAHGKPYRILEERNFHTYVWHLSEVRLASEPRSSRATVTGAGVVTYDHSSLPMIVTIRCVLMARVSLEGRLIDWQADGGGCQQILYRHL